MAHATVAGLLASAFVGIAKDMLSSAIAGQASLLCNFGVDLEDMEDMLEDISAVLEDAERRSIKEKLVQLWLKRLKNVSIDISDMLDDYQDIRDQTTPKVRTDYSLFDLFRDRSKLHALSLFTALPRFVFRVCPRTYTYLPTYRTLHYHTKELWRHGHTVKNYF
jgi:hypothetical protein